MFSHVTKSCDQVKIWISQVIGIRYAKSNIVLISIWYVLQDLFYKLYCTVKMISKSCHVVQWCLFDYGLISNWIKFCVPDGRVDKICLCHFLYTRSSSDTERQCEYEKCSTSLPILPILAHITFFTIREECLCD